MSEYRASRDPKATPEALMAEAAEWGHALSHWNEIAPATTDGAAAVGWCVVADAAEAVKCVAMAMGRAAVGKEG